jgi:hypothetical protein
MEDEARARELLAGLVRRSEHWSYVPKGVGPELRFYREGRKDRVDDDARCLAEMSCLAPPESEPEGLNNARYYWEGRRGQAREDARRLAEAFGLEMQEDEQKGKGQVYRCATQ